MTFSPNINDLALYFADDKEQVAARWVPETVYRSTPCEIQEVWKMADVFEQRLSGEDVCYVVNLSRLLGPGQAPSATTAQRPARTSDAKVDNSNPPQKPGARDLVVIPPNEPNKAYVVPRNVYTNPEKCPALQGSDASDLNFMALNEGVVLANLPKATNNSGWTCYLLSLISLKSGAVPTLDATNKHGYFGEIHKKGKR